MDGLGAPERLSGNALERRVKRWLRSGPFDCFVQTAPGLEPTLARELADGGFASSLAGRPAGDDRPARAACGIAESREPGVAHGGLAVPLDLEGIMRANLCLRTASRVLLRLDGFHASSREALYDHARRIAWEVQLGFAPGYRLRITSHGSRLQAGDEVAETVATAVSRHMRVLGLYPRATDDAPLEFHVRLVNDRCTISLNTSGEHLHRRGVRTLIGTAPLRETVAAALALEAYDGQDVVVDPFCGAGTLLLEASDVIRGLPPGRGRGFAFEHAAWHRPGRWREVRRQAGLDRADDPADAVLATSAAEPGGGALPHGRAGVRLLGFDTDPAALEAARGNAAGAAYAGIQLAVADGTGLDYSSLLASASADGFTTAPSETGSGSGARGLVLANLPWGVRLGDPRVAALTLHDLLGAIARGGAAWDLALLTAQPELVRRHGAYLVRDERAVAVGGLRVALVLARTKQTA